MTPVLRRLAAAIVLLLAVVRVTESAGRVDPRLHFRRIRTAHFTIYFHQGGDALAARLARDRKSTRLNSSHIPLSRMPSSA